VFSDLDMPNLDGFGLLERIRTHSNAGIAELPVIIVTGAEKDEDAKLNALQRGATDFITKPFKSTDIIARARAHADYQRTTRALADAASADSLTGLANHKAFIDKLEKDLSFCHRHQHPIAVALFEISDFKSLFLDVGRQGSDVIVKEIAKVISKTVRLEDTVSRYSMSRFAVSLPTAKHEGLAPLSERILATVAKFNVRRKGEPISIGMHCGLVAIDNVDTTLSATQLVDQAEKALARAQANHAPLDIMTIHNAASTAAALSIDALLSEVKLGAVPSGADIAAALMQLKPLLRKLSAIQKQQLIQD